ncbi:FABP family protein [Aeromonas veronii]|uniref:FABP family protein n=1 Tax=Aeromonas veronii TaxID=654 RepID=UPI003D1F7B12
MKRLIFICSVVMMGSSFAVSAEEVIDYGPLAKMIGKWQTVQAGGVDMAPGQEGSAVGKGGPAVEPFYEVLTVEEAATATNASEQHLAALSYVQEVFRKRDGVKFHDQRGFFLYDKEKQMVYNVFCIPRATCVVAEGAAGERLQLKATKELGQVAESEFMHKKDSTTAFMYQLDISEPDKIKYNQVTSLQVYDKPFNHTDSSVLERVK